MEKEKSIRVSESTYNIIKEDARKRMQSIKTVVRLAIEKFTGKKK